MRPAYVCVLSHYIPLEKKTLFSHIECSCVSHNRMLVIFSIQRVMLFYMSMALCECFVCLFSVDLLFLLLRFFFRHSFRYNEHFSHKRNSIYRFCLSGIICVVFIFPFFDRIFCVHLKRNFPNPIDKKVFFYFLDIQFV